MVRLLFPAVFTLGTLVGCSSTEPARIALQSPPIARMEITGGFCVAEPTAAIGLQAAPVAGTERSVYLHATPELVVNDVDIAYVTSDNRGMPIVAVQFSTAGARKLARITRENLGKTLAVCVNGEIVALTPIQNAVTDTEALITGDFTEDQARRIADAILRW